MTGLPTASQLIYPELPRPITASNLKVLFTPSYMERKWAGAS
jgi:hypothetical protein